MKELILTEQTNQTFISFNRIPDVLCHLGTEIVVASDGPLNLGAPEASELPERIGKRVHGTA
jgi:hypothetical protein